MALELISGAAVRRRLAPGAAELTVVDARPHAAYQCGHIPGALSLAWEPWCDPPPDGAPPPLGTPGYWGTLVTAAPAWYAQRLEACGLSSAPPLVVYADGPRSKGREGRIAWMLLYLGARQVALLDGGWSAWRAQGGAVSTRPAPVRRGHFSVAVQAHRRWTHAQLAQAYRDQRLPPLIDTRTPAEYVGACYDYLPRKGHLPGARLRPFAALFAGSQHYVGGRVYRARRSWVLPPGSVAYCEVGVRASLLALLHELYTGEVVGVYDGSLMEWGLDGELPVQRGGTPGDANRDGEPCCRTTA